MTPYKETLISELTESTAYILSYNDNLWSKNTFADYNFSSVKPYHDIVVKICTFIKGLTFADYRIYTDKQIESFSSILNALSDTYQKISDYSLDSTDFLDEYMLIEKNYISIYEDLITHSKDFIIVTLLSKAYLNNNLINILSESNQQLESIKKINKDAENDFLAVEKNNKQSKELLSSLEIALENVAIVKYNSIFEKESNKNRIASNWWLAIVWLNIGALIGFAFYIINDKNFSTDTHSLIEVISTRIIVISSLFIGLSLCIKNYNAHKHNQTINKHRQNALNTFETFVKSAKGDIQIEQAILLEATRTIFGNQATGFSNNDVDSDSSSRIIEIIKNISNVKQP